jgi:hypothetical protein
VWHRFSIATSYYPPAEEQEPPIHLAKGPHLAKEPRRAISILSKGKSVVENVFFKEGFFVIALSKNWF